MAFVNVLLLFGILAVSIPIIIQLLTRRHTKKIMWGAMVFLQAAMNKRKRKVLLEDILLLACRCLLPALAALALARPFVTPGSRVPWVVVLPMILLAITLFGISFAMWRYPKWRRLSMAVSILLAALSAAAVLLERKLNLSRFGGGANKDVALIVDGSSSMSMTGSDGKTNFENAIEEAGKYIEGASRGTAFSLILGGPVPEILTPVPVSDRRVLLDTLKRMRPSQGTMRAAPALAAAAVTVVLSYAVLVFGEIAPKQSAIAAGERFAHRVAPVLRAWAWCVHPVVWLVNAGSRLVLRPFGVKTSQALVPAVTEDQILLQVEAGEQQGTVESDEKEMIENVFELNDLTAADVMVHRKDVVALPAEASWEEIRDTIRRAGVSRIPIYRGSIDTIEGVLNARDFLLRSVDSKSFAISALLRKPMFVPETVKADVLLKRMQKRKQSLAVVVDDYGGTSGIVSVEDLVEQIVGDLYDEYDSPDDIVEIKDLGDGKWLVPGESSIDDVNEAVGAELEEGEFPTIAGWIVERLDSIPAQGADVDVPEHGLSMKIVKMDGRRIDSVLVRRTAPDPSR